MKYALLLSNFAFLWFSPASAQFKLVPKPNFFAFDEKKKIEYYSPLRYNRAEGLFPAIGVRLRDRDDSPLSVFVDAGYGLKSEKFRFNAGFDYEIPAWEIFKIGGKYFDDTFTQDGWIISGVENSLAALFLREDFRDYFRAKGYTAWISKDFEEAIHFRLAFWSGEYESMKKETDWSFFGGDKKFRGNPPVAEGTENKLRLEVIIDRLDNPLFPMEGWYLEGAFEKGGDFLGGDFDQSGVFLTGKILKPTISNQRLVLTARYGSRGDSRAPQHLMSLGGITTLRGYKYKAYRNGSNLAFGTFQYYFNGDILQKLPLQRIPLYSSLGLILFVEVGALWNGEASGLIATNVGDSPDWKSDAGFSLTVTGEFIRVDFARRLDRGHAEWEISFRLLPKL
jgi:hypothetical protein